jgi:hypothetical protein
MKYSIAYYDNFGLTKHCFDNTKDLKKILKEIESIKIINMSDNLPKNMRIKCIDHNHKLNS